MALRNTRIEMTVEQVYGRPVAELQGSLTGRQEFSEFGFVPAEPVQFLALNGQVITHDPASDHKFGGPRLLITTRQRRTITYTEVDGPMRLARTGEWFMNRDGRIVPGPSVEPVMVMAQAETMV